MKKSKQKRITGLPVLDKQLILFPRRSIVVALICLVAVYGVVHATMQEIQFRQQKLQFAAVEQDMQKTYNQIVATAGVPYESHASKSCNYISQEYGHGPLSCSVDYALVYSAQGTEANLNQVTQVRNLLVTKYGLGYSSPVRPTGSLDTFHYSVESQNGFGCDLQYKITNSKDYNEALNSGTEFIKSLSSTFVATYVYSCAKQPVRAVYPFTEER